MTSNFEGQLPDVKRSVSRTISDLPLHRPPFCIDIGWAENYDQLFAGNTETTSESQVLVRTLAKGRCIIVGRGGGGKTQLLYRTMRAAGHQGALPVLIDLKLWTQADYPRWKEWIASDIGAGASYLLARFSQPRVDALVLDYLPPPTVKLLIVDGLNEIAAPVGQEILVALDEIARDRLINLS